MENCLLRTPEVTFCISVMNLNTNIHIRTHTRLGNVLFASGDDDMYSLPDVTYV